MKVSLKAVHKINMVGNPYKVLNEWIFLQFKKNKGYLGLQCKQKEVQNPGRIVAQKDKKYEDRKFLTKYLISFIK